MFSEIFGMPIAYDMGINIVADRKRKRHRKGVCKNPPKKEVVVMTSKEVAEVSGQALAKVLKKGFM